MNNMDTTENKSDIIGKMSFYDTNGEVGEVMQYTSATKYLNAIEKELEYNMDGFKNETLLRDPELLKKVDDLFYDAYGSDNPKSIETYIELVNKESNNVQMNQDKTALNVKNLDYLKNNLKYLGFGESGNNQLVEKLSTGVEKFSIVIENKPVSPDIKENQQVNYILDFGKSKTSDNYFLNSYTAKLQEDKNDIAEHKFFVQKGNGVTAKEAYNLLSGRAINKDITNKEENKMNVWMKLNKDEGGPNINYYNKNYGFELDK